MSGIGDYTQWWREGVDAYIAGHPQSKNPHPTKDMAWDDWRAGWQFARATMYVQASFDKHRGLYHKEAV